MPTESTGAGGGTQRGMPPIEALRPTGAQIARHCLYRLARDAAIASLAAVLVVQPLYFLLLRAYCRVFFGPAPAAADGGVVPFLAERVAGNRFHLAMLMSLVFTVACHAAPWCLLNGFFTLLDSFHPDSCFQNPLARAHSTHPIVRAVRAFVVSHKIPRAKTQWPTLVLIRKALRKTVVDQVFTGPLGVFAVVYFAGYRTIPLPNAIPGFEEGRRNTPLSFAANVGKILPHVVAANLINEVGFFLVHALVHVGRLYALIHKQHHEFTGTVSMAAEYANVVEDITANILPTIIYFTYAFFAASSLNVPGYRAPEAAAGAAVSFHFYRRCWPLFATWMWMRLCETYETHSGYMLLGDRARFHDYHHTYNKGNYGTGIVMDALCNTMDNYLRHRYLEEHSADDKEAHAKAE